MKKFNSLFLVFCLTLTLILPSKEALATESTIQVSADVSITEIKEQFSKMSNEELNQYISQVRKSCSSTSTFNSTSKVYSSNTKIYSPVQYAWLAAAAIARKQGYPCAATLIECSVKNKTYSETSGAFSTKIKTTSAYKKWVKNMDKESTTFKKSDNADLFYALHTVDISVVGSSSSGAKILVRDTFDFAYDNNYDDFTSAVNDWAWLCQQAGALNKIPVYIYFYI